MARRRGLVGDGDPDADETDAGLSYSSPRPRAGGAAPEASRGWSERNKECGLVSMDEAVAKLYFADFLRSCADTLYHFGCLSSSLSSS